MLNPRIVINPYINNKIRKLSFKISSIQFCDDGKFHFIAINFSEVNKVCRMEEICEGELQDILESHYNCDYDFDMDWVLCYNKDYLIWDEGE